jgi:hypothetical protein
MANEKSAGGTPEESTVEREREWNARVDWFLQSLVQMVNNSKSPMSFGITLSVGGVLVSGELIGGQHYFEGFGNEFTGSFSDPKMAAPVKESFSRLGGNIYGAAAQSEPSGKSATGAVAGPSYIHLKNARMFPAGGKASQSTRGMFWRGKLSAVDGFTLGTLNDE